MFRLKFIAAALFLLLESGAGSFIDRSVYGDWPGKPGDPLTEVLNLLAIIVGLLLFWQGFHGRRRTRFNRVLPLAAAGLLVTSVLWSVTPSTTLTRSVAYFFLVVGAIGIVEILDTNEVMSLTALIGGLLAAVSLLLLFVFPDTVIEEESFRGVFSQKNVLGQAMVVGVLAGLHGIRIGGRQRFRSIGVTLLCTIVAFLSKSTTSLITIASYFILDFIGRFYIKGGSGRMISVCLTIAIVLASILVVINADSIFSSLEKDTTLTGRTEFWPYEIDAIYQRPGLGWGFAAFFLSSYADAYIVPFNPGEAHNGVLQLLLDTGIVGTAFFLFLWVRNLVMAVKCMNGAATEIGVSALLFLIGILLIGVSEQVLATADGPTVQFFLLGFMCEKELWLARYGRHPPVGRLAPWPVGNSPTRRRGLTTMHFCRIY
jgi:O-antigen ligase